MKTDKELNELKEAFNTVNAKLQELTEEELDYVSGGTIKPKEGSMWISWNPCAICDERDKFILP